MPQNKTQAIAGVSADTENDVMDVFPSISASYAGRIIGMICDSVPLRINGVKLSYFLFALPLALPGLVLYFLQKLLGSRYVITNRSLQIRRAWGSRIQAQVALSEIGDVAVEQLPGQAFYKAADLVVLDGDGFPLLRLGGIPRPEVFRQAILKVCNARMQNDASLAVIKARQPA